MGTKRKSKGASNSAWKDKVSWRRKILIGMLKDKQKIR